MEETSTNQEVEDSAKETEQTPVEVQETSF